MNELDPHDLASEAAAQVNDLFDALDVTKAIDNEEFRQLLDRIPIPIVISKFARGDHGQWLVNTRYFRGRGRSRQDPCEIHAEQW